MKNIQTFAAFICCAFLFACSPAGEKNILSSADWTVDGSLEFDNNQLQLTGPARLVLTSGNYKDFEMKMELMTTPGAKGEVWFHTDDQQNKGYAIAINNDREDPVWWKMSGSLLSVRNLTKSFVKENEWFTMDVKVQGKNIQILINGEPVVDYNEPVSPYRTGAHAQALLSSGKIALTSENGTIRFRKMSITPLPAVSPEEIQAQQALAVNEQSDEIIRLHQEDFPVLDYHVHLKGGLTKEAAGEQSRRLGVNYAIAPNCGIGFPITNDAEVIDFLDEMRSEPFILAMQAEGREWITTFSQEVRDEFDYVFTDALTFTDKKGRRTRLWIESETWIENEQEYMDLIVDKICDVLQEPMQIYVNPCYLPDSMSDRYDEFWTEARMNKFIDALVKSDKALEINELYNIPNKAILQKAKDAGVKFTFGSNNVTPDVSDLAYSIRMKKELGLTAADMYKPKIKI